MRAGRLDRRITLLRAVVEQDSTGEEVAESWTELATVWAETVRVSGAERAAAAQIASQSVERFRIRYSSQVRGLTTENRLRFDGRDYNIQAIREVGRREGIEIDAFTPAEQPVTVG